MLFTLTITVTSWVTFPLHLTVQASIVTENNYLASSPKKYVTPGIRFFFKYTFRRV